MTSRRRRTYLPRTYRADRPATGRSTPVADRPTPPFDLVWGTVRSRSAPLEGATITAIDDRGRERARVRADDDGRYAFGPSDHRLVLVCTAPGHEPLACRVPRGRPADIELQPSASAS